MFRPLTVTYLYVVVRVGGIADVTVSAARKGIARTQLKARQLRKRQPMVIEVTSRRRTGTLISGRVVTRQVGPYAIAMDGRTGSLKARVGRNHNTGIVVDIPVFVARSQIGTLFKE